MEVNDLALEDCDDYIIMHRDIQKLAAKRFVKHVSTSTDSKYGSKISQGTQTVTMSQDFQV